MTLELLHSVLTSTNRFLFFLNLLRPSPFFFFFLNDPPPTEIYPLPLHAALPFSFVEEPARAPPPAAEIVLSWMFPSRFSKNAIRLPSGDHNGRDLSHLLWTSHRTRTASGSQIGRAHV